MQSIFVALEIPDLGRDERMQRILCRTERLHQFEPRLFRARGEDHVILLLRSIAETANGVAALGCLSCARVSSVLHDAWTNRGLEWLEAMDRVPLLEIQASLKGFGLEEHLSTAIRFKLTQILGSPFAAPAKPKEPARRMEKPAAVSQTTWDEVIAMQKADRRRREMKRKAARMAA